MEAFHAGRRVASHVRAYGKGHYMTDPQHRPAAHQRHLEWTPSRIIRWAESSGPHTAQLVQAILAARPHPEQGYRACLGVLRLGQRYTPERLEAAAKRAVRIRATSYRSVQSILEHGLDRVPDESDQPEEPPLAIHDNVRGPQYYA